MVSSRRTVDAMKQQDAALIAAGAGLLTGTAFLLLTLNVIQVFTFHRCGSYLQS
jgi:hypothetical protein